MGLVYLYYALRLGLAGSPWLYAHLAFPVLLAVATSFSSYGIWQKGFVVYFLLAVNLDALPATGRWAEFGLADLLRRRRKRETYHLKVRRRTERKPGAVKPPPAGRE
jgi:hypothetical protein